MPVSNNAGKFIPRMGRPAPTPATPGTNTSTPFAAPAPTNGGYNPGVGTPGAFGLTPGQAPIPGVAPNGTTWGVDPTGNATPYSPTQNSFGGGTTWNAGSPTNLNDLAMQNMMKLLGMMKGFGTMGGPADPLAREVPGAAPPREVPSTMADREPAEAAAFGRAKDRIGKIGGAALSTLKDRSTAGGRAGSGLEAKDTRELVANTASGLGDVVRDQAIDRLDRHDQIDDRNLGAGITQRSQDLGTRSGDLSSQVQQRGQDYNALLNPYQNPLMSMVPSLFGMFQPRY